MAPAATQSPVGFGLALAAIDFLTSSPQEIVIVGDRRRSDVAALLRTVRARLRLNKVLVVSDEPTRDSSIVPLLAGRRALEGRATAYVCRAGTCERPVTDPGDLEAQLATA